MIGLVHPCKIYNILAVGAPIIYIGPQISHVTELLERAQGYPFIRAQHGEADRLVKQIRELASNGGTVARQTPTNLMEVVSKSALLPKLISILEKKSG